MGGDPLHLLRTGCVRRHTRDGGTVVSGAHGNEVSQAGPASFAQQRLWYLDQLEPGRPVYALPRAFRIRGTLDLEALRRSLIGVVARHDELRATFVEQEGQASRRVGRAACADWRVESLHEYPPHARLDEALRRAGVEAETPFDLARGPLLRARVWSLAPDDHVFLLTVHHIVCDLPSLGVLLRELGEGTRCNVPCAGPGGGTALEEDRPSPSRVEGEDGGNEGDLAYWMELLGGELKPLSLPGDREAPSGPSFRGGRVPFVLDREAVERVRHLAREGRTTPFIVLLAAFKAFLHRISGEDDIRVGSTLPGARPGPAGPSVGLHANVVVFRTDTGGNPSFSDLVARLRDTAEGVHRHQHLPIDRIVEALGPGRRGGETPLFQVMLSCAPPVGREFRIDGLEVTPLPVHTGTARFDLLMELEEGPDGYSGHLEYSADLFDAASAQRLADGFLLYLDALLDHPEAPIGSAALLTPAEEACIEGWNRTDVTLDEGVRLHDLVRASARRTPDAVAVRGGDQELTYRELEVRAYRLAHHLQAAGVGPDTMVGVFLDRSPDLLVTLLGILEAGAAYLPLDPSFPSDRLAYMLSDSGAGVVVSRVGLADSIPGGGAGVQVICLDGDAETLAKRPSTPPDNRSTEDTHLAYVIYTSGSTGAPKGVQLPHRAVVNFLRSVAVSPGCGPGDTLLAVTTLSFDISVLELFLPLVVGGTVHIAAVDEAGDGLRLKDLLCTSGATLMQATPATWLMLLDSGWMGSPGLTVLCGGEAWPPGLARELLRRCGALWNMYGPTETTIWSLCARIDSEDQVHLGRPLANTRIHILDRYRQPVPANVPGELYIGGAGLARGYHGRPELTDERFIENPFGPGRLYRTGDSVRYRMDGTIRFLGRLDNQVKVRGYRIELGEIEAALERHPGVRQPVVVVVDDGAGDRRLVAHVLNEPGASPTGSELRSHLRQHLPDYMIPHLFVEVDAFPLTANGKVDRRALPDPLEGERGADRQVRPPRTANEQLVARLWREVLDVAEVDVQDNFFDLGGHSLLSTQVVYRIEKETGHRLSPRMFVSQSLEQIAAGLPGGEEYAEEERERRGSTCLEGVEPARREGGLLSRLRSVVREQVFGD